MFWLIYVLIICFWINIWIVNKQKSWMIEQMLREFIERLAAQELNIPDGISLTGMLIKNRKFSLNRSIELVVYSYFLHILVFNIFIVFMWKWYLSKILTIFSINTYLELISVDTSGETMSMEACLEVQLPKEFIR